jgi:hypothetical protein
MESEKKFAKVHTCLDSAVKPILMLEEGVLWNAWLHVEEARGLGIEINGKKRDKHRIQKHHVFRWWSDASGINVEKELDHAKR